MTLNLESFDEKSKKKSTTKYKAALGVGSVVSLFGIGSTLAANISLNGGGNVEFGQGVATTAACDEDGFSITPVTVYDNAHSIFRVASVEVTGINLTPEGTNWAESGDVIDKNESGGVDLTDAKLQFPGQYYDTETNDWKRTCDNVVLDFASYTNDAQYSKYTLDAYEDRNNGAGHIPGTWLVTTTTSPLMWSQKFADDSSDLYDDVPNGYPNEESPSIAAVIDTDETFQYGYASNFFVGGGNRATWINGYANLYLGSQNPNGESSSFAFKFYEPDFRPNAAAISKITVQSMKLAPDNYYASWNDGPGTSQWLNGG